MLNRQAADGAQEQRAKRFDYKYGCVFCMTGQEDSVIGSLEAQNPECYATSVSQTKWKTDQYGSRKVTQVIFPGYVYFQTKSNDPPDLRYIEQSIRLLETTKGSWTLSGMEAWFAKWIIEKHGVIGFSTATVIDNRAMMLSGPLKELEQYIIKVDKHHRGGLVALPFHDREGSPRNVGVG